MVPKEIINMKIEEVSAVDKAATKKKFLLIKRDTEGGIIEEPDKGGENMDELKDLLAKIDDEELRAKIEEEIEKLESAEEGDEEGKEDVIDKSELPEELRKRFDDMEAAVKEAQDLAKREREKRLEVEFNKKAKEYSNVGEVEKIASILMKVSESDEELASDIEEILKSAEERLTNSELFLEKGDGGNDATNAEEVIEKKTKELMKADTGLTYAKAQRQVLRENPDLYTEYSNQRAQ